MTQALSILVGAQANLLVSVKETIFGLELRASRLSVNIISFGSVLMMPIDILFL